MAWLWSQLVEETWMNSTILTTLLIFLSVLGISYFQMNSTRKHLPPGPVGLPIVGCLPFVYSDICGTFAQWARKYGDIYSLYLGPKLIIVLNSYDTFRELLIKRGDAFSGRPETFFTKQITGGHGIIWGNGHPWKIQRKFALVMLRQLGANTTAIEDTVQTELRHLVAEIESYAGKAFDPHHLINFTIANAISCVVFGRRFEYTNDKFTRILHLMSGWSTKYNFVHNLLNFWPWLHKLPGNWGNSKESFRDMKKLVTFIKEEVQYHRNTLDPDHIRDFVDAYLVELEKINQTEEVGTTFSDAQLEMIIRDLFVAAIETTQGTLMWGLLHMARNPHVQVLVHEEIVKVVGDGRPVTLNDKEDLPYTRAVIYEIQRTANIDPFSVPRRANQDVEYNGFLIPKDADIYSNFWVVNQDEQNFKDAKSFDPTRYLDDQGNLRRLKPYLPFGMGQRICIGEGLAKTELFLIFSNLVKNFSFEKVPDEPELSLDGVFGVVYTPKPFKLIVIPWKTKAE